jgi:hypothetical protein
MRRPQSGPIVGAERVKLPSDVASWIPASAGMTRMRASPPHTAENLSSMFRVICCV